MPFDPINLLIYGIPILVAITPHEAGHAYAAMKLGDHTARFLGRVTLNPIKHIDPLGTILLPLLLIFSGSPFLIGWAKPVPVNFSQLGTKRISRRMAILLVAAAGPAANLLIAAGVAILFHTVELLPTLSQAFVAKLFVVAISLNVFFAVFNLIPIPPLDGGRIAVSLLPARPARFLNRLEPYGFLILILFLFILPMLGRSIGLRLDLLPFLVSKVMLYLSMPFYWLAGLG